MSTAWAIAMAVGVFVGTSLGAVLSDLISEEVRNRLDGLPRALVRLSARILPKDQRAAYEGDWLGELDEILHGAEARPITRLVRGGWFALGLLRGAWYVRGEYAPRERRTERFAWRWLGTALLSGVLSAGGRILFEEHLIERVPDVHAEQFVLWFAIAALAGTVLLSLYGLFTVWRVLRLVKNRVKEDHPGLGQRELATLCAQERAKAFRME